jgi:hypothetical protein
LVVHHAKTFACVRSAARAPPWITFNPQGLHLSDPSKLSKRVGPLLAQPETDTTSQGESIEEALANLREATELYLEEFPLASVGQPFITTFLIAEHA